jgi:hypothetical protein
MPSPPAVRAAPRGRIQPALTSFIDECRDAVLRMLAYVGALALIGLTIFYVAWPLTDAAVSAAIDPPGKPGWSAIARPHPAFALSQIDSAGKTETYDLLRHPEGGRKDILRFAAPGQAPGVEIEIYRLGGEAADALPPADDLTARVNRDGSGALQAAGLIDSKFGPVTLLELTGRTGRGPACLGFYRRVDQASLRISGWTCQGDGVAQLRAAVSCLLDRLVLLGAGADTALAETFARAELRRTGCNAGPPPSAVTADWVLGAQDPPLRGAL